MAATYGCFHLLNFHVLVQFSTPQSEVAVLFNWNLTESHFFRGQAVRVGQVCGGAQLRSAALQRIQHI